MKAVQVVAGEAPVPLDVDLTGFYSLCFLRVLISGVDVPGYAWHMAAVALFGGIQLLDMGILGEPG